MGAATVSTNFGIDSFGSVRRLTLTRSGAFFIFDERDLQIRAFDSTGRFLGDVGRQGPGPGEYASVAGMVTVGDSLLLVLDPRNGRINLFDRSGTARQPLRFARGGHYAEKGLEVDRNGVLYVRAPLITAERRSAAIGSQYLRLRLGGTVLDSMALPQQPTDQSSFVLHTADGPRWNFTNRSLFAVLWEGRLATAEAMAYELRIQDPGGSERVIRRAADRVPLTPRERREWTAWSEYLARRLGHSPVPIPRVKPVIRDLRGDHWGRIWVNLYSTGSIRRSGGTRAPGDDRPALTVRETNVYDVLDERGQLLGRVTLPPGSALLAIGEQIIWVRAEDREGRQSAVRYRLVGLRDPA